MNIWRLISHHVNPSEAAAVYQEKGFIAVGWGRIGDLAKIQPQSPQQIAEAIRTVDSSPKNSGSGGRVLWSFLYDMAVGDQVIVSDGKRRLQVMEVTGTYYWEPTEDPLLQNFQHRRTAKRIALNPDELWKKLGGFAPAWSPRWTLCLCNKL